MKNVLLLFFVLLSCGKGEIAVTPINDTSYNSPNATEASPFISTWIFEDNPSITSDDKNWNEIILPLPEKDEYGQKLSYDFIVNWGDGNASKVSSYNDPNRIHKYNSAGEYKITIKGIMQGWTLDYRRDSYKIFEVNDLGNTGLINLNGAFAGAINLRKFYGGNTSKVNNMAKMFTTNEKLINLDISSFDTSNVIDLSSMFEGCIRIDSLDLSHFKTSKVTNANRMFYNMPNLEYVNVEGWQPTSIDKDNFFPSSFFTNKKMEIYCDFPNEPFKSICR